MMAATTPTSSRFLLLRDFLAANGTKHDTSGLIPLDALMTPLTKTQLDAIRGAFSPQILHQITVAWHCSVVYWLDIAAAAGRLDWIDYIHCHGGHGSSLALDLAAASGSLVCVQYLHLNRTDGATTLAMDLAARAGHFDIVRFLHLRRCEGCTSDAMYYAAKLGYEDIVRFLLDNRFVESTSTRALDAAARNGHYGIVQLLHAAYAGMPRMASAAAMDLAAAGGHLYVVCFLHEHRSEGCTNSALILAAARGHIEVVQFLVQNRKEGCVTAALEAANENSAIEVASYLSQVLDRGEMACSRIGCRLHCRKHWMGLEQL
ncbi:hypothetical protein Ae201684P_013818 [Aphanomyces euteiches]|uniref:Uncharacterized protein n=1 Tax=Aphanomyces euteiches TaxID=100861 RepID=A0A6G0W5W8_9STRA|nr:hypothetical protein Ae201684_018326 [Aphanomyces euteiches]KAH9082915.1 hypothetical protein Ae201684P_013818 [Aphanomyces euteiches]